MATAFWLLSLPSVVINVSIRLSRGLARWLLTCSPRRCTDVQIKFLRIHADSSQRGGETEPLISPENRVGSASIASQENYGIIQPMVPNQSESGLTEEQRKRIADIGREIGNQMLPINSASRASMTPRRGASPETGSVASSRPTTPQPDAQPPKKESPKTTKPADGKGSQIETAEEFIEAGVPTSAPAKPPAPAKDQDDAVVHKTLFHGTHGGGSKKPNGKNKKNKKGKAKGKKK